MVFFSSAEVYGDYEGIMSEDVMEKNPIKDTYQMNDYAITKWAGELMCMNSAGMFGTETVRVRPVNCYGPGEHYTPYRGFIPKRILKNSLSLKKTVKKSYNQWKLMEPIMRKKMHKLSFNALKPASSQNYRIFNSQ